MPPRKAKIVTDSDIEVKKSPSKKSSIVVDSDIEVKKPSSKKSGIIVDSDIEVNKPTSKKSSTSKITEVVETAPDNVIKVKKMPVKRIKKDVTDVLSADDIKVKKISNKKASPEVKDTIVVSKDLEIITSNKLNVNNDTIIERSESENKVLMNKLDDIKKCWMETIKVIESMRNQLSILDQKATQHLKEMIQISEQLNWDETEINSKTVFNFKSNNDINKKIEPISVEKSDEKVKVVIKKIAEDNKIIDSSDSESTDSSDSDISDNSNKTKKLKTKKLSLKKKLIKILILIQNLVLIPILIKCKNS